MNVDIRARLMEMRDEKYRAFSCRLMPTVDPSSVIGVRAPQLRKLAKELTGTPEAEAFLAALPHGTYDENTLHGILISQIRDYDACVAALNAFLPYVDNWATCDMTSPKAFKKHPPQLSAQIEKWIASGETYTVRFGIGTLLQFYLDEAFDERQMALAAAVRSQEYYVNMMIAWYFATALAKQPDAAMPYLREKRLPAWTHNKAIQKAIESYRVTDELKAELRTLRTGRGK